MSKQGLKPCPFCGEAPTTGINYSKCGGGELKLTFSVVCLNCRTVKSITREVEGKSFGKYIDAMADAIELWNTRAQ